MWVLWVLWGIGCVGPETTLLDRESSPHGKFPSAELEEEPIEDVGSNHVPRDDVSWPNSPPSVAILPLDDSERWHAAVTDAFFAEGTLHDFRISLPFSSQQALTVEPREWVPATFSAEGEGSWPVHVALKGTTSFRDLTGKASFKVSFAQSDPEARFHGLRRLTLNAMVQDASMLGEHAAYWLYRRHGVPAPRHTYARLTVDGLDFGLHGVVETMDEQLLKTLFPGDNNGNLYEGNVADFMTGRTERFELEEGDGLWEPYTDIDALIVAIEAAGPDGYVAALNATFKLDELLRMWAIDLVTVNVDGYAWYANNYMAYHGEERWRLLPWGHDQCFGWSRDVSDYSRLGGELVTRCAETPACLERLEQAMLDLLPVWEQGDLEAMVVATTALIQGDCAADPRAERLCDTGAVLRFIRERPATVREQLGVD